MSSEQVVLKTCCIFIKSLGPGVQRIKCDGRKRPAACRDSSSALLRPVCRFSSLRPHLFYICSGALRLRAAWKRLTAPGVLCGFASRLLSVTVAAMLPTHRVYHWYLAATSTCRQQKHPSQILPLPLHASAPTP